MTAPTIACELETGTSGMVGRPCEASRRSSPSEANTNNTTECAMTTTQAATGDIGTIPLPTVNITRFEYVATPTATAIPPSRKSCCAEVRV